MRHVYLPMPDTESEVMPPETCRGLPRAIRCRPRHEHMRPPHPKTRRPEARRLALARSRPSTKAFISRHIEPTRRLPPVISVTQLQEETASCPLYMIPRALRNGAGYSLKSRYTTRRRMAARSAGCHRGCGISARRDPRVSAADTRARIHACGHRGRATIAVPRHGAALLAG